MPTIRSEGIFRSSAREGSATNDMTWVVSGVLLLVISVLCTWNWLLGGL